MYNSLCSEIREAWAIDASKGLKIHAFPEGSKAPVGDVCQHPEGVSERHVRLVVPAIRHHVAIHG